MARGPFVHEAVHFADDLEAVEVDRGAHLRGAGAAEQRLDHGGAVVHTRRYGEVELRQFGRAERRGAQYVAYLGGVAVGRALHEIHAFDVHVGFEKAVEEHQAAHAAAVEGVARGQHVGQPHRHLDRHGHLHGVGHAARDLGVGVFDLLRRGVAVGGLEEDVQLDGRGACAGHLLRVVDPLVAAGHAVDAGDDRQNLLRFADQVQEAALVVVAEVAKEIELRIAVHRVRHVAQRRRVLEDLFFENRLQHHGPGAVAGAEFDLAHVGGIGRAADDYRAREFEAEIGCFHRMIVFVLFPRGGYPCKDNEIRQKVCADCAIFAS